MTNLNMAALYKEAQEKGVTNSLLPEGPANLVITRINVTPPAQGKTGVQFGMFVKITDGPHAGVQGWWNQNIGPDNAVGNGIFFRLLDTLGLEASWYTHEAVTLEHIGEALIGRPFSGTISNRKGKDGVPKWNDVKGVKLLTADAAAPAAEAPAPAPAPAVSPVTLPVPPAPAEAPAPAAPAPVEAVPAPAAPVPAPAAPQAVSAPPAPAAPAPAAPAAEAAPAAAPAVQTGPDGLPVPPSF